MEEGTGNVVGDSSNNGNTGTRYGATWVTGQVGNALSFDGVDDYVDCGAGSSLNLTDEITVEFWLYLRSAIQVDTRFISKSVSAWEIDSWGTNIVFIAPPGTTQTVVFPSSKTPLNQWNHIVVTVKSGSTNKNQAYVNGINVTTGRNSATIPDNLTRSLQFGGTSAWAGKLFNGSLDEVRIYNRVLTAEEIRRHFSKGRGGTSPFITSFRE